MKKKTILANKNMMETICLSCETRFDDCTRKTCPKCDSDDLGLIGKEQKLLRC